MNKKLLILSKCQRADARALFHFKGFYCGEKIKSIEVCGNFPFIVGEDYLIWGEVVGIEDSMLILKTLSVKLVS
jgi:hypothetical protein